MDCWPLPRSRPGRRPTRTVTRPARPRGQPAGMRRTITHWRCCMVEALLISTLVLWMVVLILTAVIFALVRQVGVLHERVAPAGALASHEGPRIGEAAPRIAALDWAG